MRTAGQGGAVNFWRWLNFRRQINSNMYELPLQDSDVPLSWDIPRPPENIDEDHMAGPSSPDRPCHKEEGNANEERGEEHEEKEGERVEHPSSSCLNAVDARVFPVFSPDDMKKDLTVHYPIDMHAMDEVMIRFGHVKVTQAETPAKYWVYKATTGQQFYQVFHSSSCYHLFLLELLVIERFTSDIHFLLLVA